MKKKIAALHKKGWTQKKIGQYLDLTQSGVAYYYKQLGLNPSRRWTPARIATAVSLYKRGKTFRQIARILGTNSRHVRKHVNTAGIPSRPSTRFGKGRKNPAWNGGKTYDRGYLLVYCPSHPYSVKGHVRLHRLVMERRLGRYLHPREVVHHKNGDKRDNRFENLELFQNNGLHLRESLKGRCPKWSVAGKHRICEALQQYYRRGRKKSLSKTCDLL